MSTLDELEYYCREENVYGALMFVGGWAAGHALSFDFD